MGKTVTKTRSDKQILKKHVSAIHIGAKLTLLQRKLVNALLYNAYETLLTDQDHVINTRLLCEMIGFDSKNVTYLKNALKGLMETVVEFDVMEDDGKQSWEAMVLLPYAKIQGGTCTYRYEKALAEKLYHPDVYSKINLSVLRDMKSAHLKRDVILPAMKEVNAVSNIQIELRTMRTGRSVSAVQFTVTPNLQTALLGIEEEDDISLSKAYAALREEGISKTLARSWVIDLGEAYVLEKLALTRSQDAYGKIKSSRSGFLKAAIEGNYQNLEAQKRQEKMAADKKREEKLRQERELERLNADYRELEGQYREYCYSTILAGFDALSQEEQHECSTEFTKRLKHSLEQKEFRENGWKSRLVLPLAREFWSERSLELQPFDQFVEDQGGPSPNALKTKINELEAIIK